MVIGVESGLESGAAERALGQFALPYAVRRPVS